MKLRDAIAMLIFWAIYAPLSVLVWYIFELPSQTMVLIFLLGVVYVILYLLFAILLTPPKRPVVRHIEPELIEVRTVEPKKITEAKPRRRRVRKAEEKNDQVEIKEEVKENETQEKPKRRRRRKATRKAQVNSEEPKEALPKDPQPMEVELPRAQEKEVVQETHAPAELPSPFSDFDEVSQDLD